MILHPHKFSINQRVIQFYCGILTDKLDIRLHDIHWSRGTDWNILEINTKSL